VDCNSISSYNFFKKQFFDFFYKSMITYKHAISQLVKLQTMIEHDQNL